MFSTLLSPEITTCSQVFLRCAPSGGCHLSRPVYDSSLIAWYGYCYQIYFVLGFIRSQGHKNNNQTWLSISKVQSVLCILSRISVCLPSMNLHHANILLVQKCACIAIFELGFFTWIHLRRAYHAKLFAEKGNEYGSWSNGTIDFKGKDFVIHSPIFYPQKSREFKYIVLMQ